MTPACIVGRQGSLDLDRKFRESLSKAIFACSKSREQIAEDLTAAAGMRVTVRMLNDYTCTAECRAGYRVPAVLIAPLCEVLGTDSIARAVLPPSLQRALAIGEEELRTQRHRQEKNALVKQVLIAEGQQSR